MHVSSTRIGEVLHLSASQCGSVLQLIDSVNHGLPLAALHRIVRAVAPRNIRYRDLLVSRASYARRMQSKRLSRAESERVVRVASVWLFALEIWRDEAKARQFLHQPHPLLGGRVPATLAIEGSLGAQAVEEVLGGLRHGTAA